MATHLVVSVLVLTSFLVDGQMTGVDLTTNQVTPATGTAGGMAASLSTAVAAAMVTSIADATTMSAGGMAASLSTAVAAATVKSIADATTMSASTTTSINAAVTSAIIMPTTASTSKTTPDASITAPVQSVTATASASAANLEKLFPTNDPTYARMVAAVVGGCGLFILNTVFFIIVSMMLRYSVRMERHRMPKIPRKSLTGGGGIFYGGNEVQSNQALFAPSLSATNIVGGASDIQLDTRGGGRGVYHNRAFDSEAAGSQVTISADDGYKPIEIKSQTAGVSRA